MPDTITREHTVTDTIDIAGQNALRCLDAIATAIDAFERDCHILDCHNELAGDLRVEVARVRGIVELLPECAHALARHRRIAA